MISIAISGTNGKSTLANTLISIFEGQGLRAFRNKVPTGQWLSGYKNEEVAVFDVDELAVVSFLDAVTPDYVVITNLARNPDPGYEDTPFVKAQMTDLFKAATAANFIFVDDSNLQDLIGLRTRVVTLANDLKSLLPDDRAFGQLTTRSSELLITEVADSLTATDSVAGLNDNLFTFDQHHSNIGSDDLVIESIGRAGVSKLYPDLSLQPVNQFTFKVGSHYGSFEPASCAVFEAVLLGFAYLLVREIFGSSVDAEALRTAVNSFGSVDGGIRERTASNPFALHNLLEANQRGAVLVAIDPRSESDSGSWLWEVDFWRYPKVRFLGGPSVEVFKQIIEVNGGKWDDSRVTTLNDFEQATARNKLVIWVAGQRPARGAATKGAAKMGRSNR